MKSKAKISDYGGQTIRRGENGKYYREPDGLEVEIVEQAKEPKRLQLKYQDIFHWYFSRNLLCSFDSTMNAELYAIGLRYQNVWHRSCYNPRVTAVLDKDHIYSDISETNVNVLDAQTKLWRTNKAISKYVPMLYQVLIENVPAKRKVNKFKEGLNALNDYWSE